MNPLSGVLGEAWQMYNAHAWHLLAIAIACGLVNAIEPAGDILRHIVTEAEGILRERPGQVLR